MSRLDNINAGEILPEREFKVSNVELFMYNAALWNAHRIHFDQDYATEVEGYPGLVIAGPQMGDWLTQTVLEWMGDDGLLESIEYRNRQAAYVGDVLCSGGSVVSVDHQNGRVVLDLFVRNQDEEVILPGSAIVQFSSTS